MAREEVAKGATRQSKARPGNCTGLSCCCPAGASAKLLVPGLANKLLPPKAPDGAGEALWPKAPGVPKDALPDVLNRPPGLLVDPNRPVAAINPQVNRALFSSASTSQETAAAMTWQLQ